MSLIWIRGYVEKVIEMQLTNENLASLHLVEALKPFIKNKEDVIFGYILGWVSASMAAFFIQTLGRQPTSEEMNEVAEAVKNSLTRIKSRIYETLT